MLIKARQARGEVYCTLTNNSSRGTDEQPGVDAANPRANNTMGDIIKWKEDGDFDAAGPAGCEITGVTSTPDLRTMFVNIQHPGENASERSDPNEPMKISKWPNGARPRSATVVVRRKDGGVIGA